MEDMSSRTLSLFEIKDIPVYKKIILDESMQEYVADIFHVSALSSKIVDNKFKTCKLCDTSLTNMFSHTLAFLN